jgi:hypothetical protein
MALPFVERLYRSVLRAPTCESVIKVKEGLICLSTKNERKLDKTTSTYLNILQHWRTCCVDFALVTMLSGDAVQYLVSNLRASNGGNPDAAEAANHTEA